MIEYAERTYSIKRLYRKILFQIAMRTPFLKAEFRARIYKWGGVNIINPHKTFIGYDVMFDDLYPEDITIEEGTYITSGGKILAHFMDPDHDYNHMNRGKVHIERNVFIGMNVVIVKPVTIHEGAVIGANAVITKEIPANTVWGGNPARMIKVRSINYLNENNNH